MFGCNSTIHSGIKNTGLITSKELSVILSEIKSYNGGKVISYIRVSEFINGNAKYLITYEWEEYWSSDY